MTYVSFIIIIIRVFCPRAGPSLQTQNSPLYTPTQCMIIVQEHRHPHTVAKSYSFVLEFEVKDLAVGRNP